MAFRAVHVQHVAEHRLFSQFDIHPYRALHYDRSILLGEDARQVPQVALLQQDHHHGTAHVGHTHIPLFHIDLRLELRQCGRLRPENVRRSVGLQ